MTESQKRSSAKQFDFVEYTKEGFEVFGNITGHPRIKAVVPAPYVNCITEADREKRYRDAIDGIILRGYFITKCQRIRNIAFDRKDQKTTLSLEYRPCMSTDEIQHVAESIRTILKRRCVPA